MTPKTATRRGVLAAAIALSGGMRPLAAATPMPESATLIAPGPREGIAARLAAQAAQGLARGLVHATALRVAVVGGPDGITAANRFAATMPPEAPSLLLLPGLAAHALLVGDSRARYAPAHWPALAASVQPAILAGRGRLGGSQQVRLAVPGPGAPETAALLALEALGVGGGAVVVHAGMAAEAAVAAGAADAVVLTGPGAPARATALGLAPWFAFDGPAGARDPALPLLPSLGELLLDPASPELLAALRAAGTGLRLRGAVVLPALTAADTVALWRGAARHWAEAEPDAGAPGTRLLAAEEAAEVVAALAPPPEAALAYRVWLQRRLGWQAG